MFRFNHHHQGAYYLSLLKLQLLKYIVVVESVVALHSTRWSRVTKCVRQQKCERRADA